MQEINNYSELYYTNQNAGQNRKFSILNFGCQMNESDTEHYAGQLFVMGYEQTDDVKQADLILFNTCCVRDSAEQKILGKIGEVKHLKKANKELIVIIAGCMAQKEGKRLVEKFPYIDCVIGTHYVNSFTEILKEFQATRKRLILTEQSADKNTEFVGVSSRKSSFAAWIPIMYGCNNFCTYCIVPYVRGRERSRQFTEIVAEIQGAVAEGYKEFTLLGQNVNSYGKEFEGEDNFARLLEIVDEIPGVERIRYMTSHPRDMTERVIKTVAQSKHICEHFHLPIQAGGDRILARMNRGYTVAEYLKLVELVRKHVPHATLSTDIIVGFPGETEDDFQGTLRAVEAVGYDVAYTFLYSKRTGTPASEYSEQVPLAIKKERFNRLLALQNEISLAKNQKYLGQTVEVICEGTSKNSENTLSGRTRGNKIVLWDKVAGHSPAVGELVNVDIKQAQTWLLKGDFVC